MNKDMETELKDPAVEPGQVIWGGVQDDGRASLAIAGGLVAALIGGGLWAAVALLLNLEVGWVAWGIGALVGGAMGRITTHRSQTLGLTAAGVAAVGLLAGKLMIVAGSAGAISDALVDNPEYLEGAVAWEMYEADELSPETIEQIDAAHAAGDTLSDALWMDMRRQAAAKIQGMTDEERREIAQQLAEGYISQLGIVDAIRSQLGLWDLIWFTLALVTAFQMVGRRS